MAGDGILICFREKICLIVFKQTFVYTEMYMHVVGLHNFQIAKCWFVYEIADIINGTKELWNESSADVRSARFRADKCSRLCKTLTLQLSDSLQESRETSAELFFDHRTTPESRRRNTHDGRALIVYNTK